MYGWGCGAISAFAPRDNGYLTLRTVNTRNRLPSFPLVLLRGFFVGQLLFPGSPRTQHFLIPRCISLHVLALVLTLTSVKKKGGRGGGGGAYTSILLPR